MAAFPPPSSLLKCRIHPKVRTEIHVKNLPKIVSTTLAVFFSLPALARPTGLLRFLVEQSFVEKFYYNFLFSVNFCD